MPASNASHESADEASHDLGTLQDELGDGLDAAIFEQILEMDDDQDRDFSSSIVSGFFDQAITSFQELEEALQENDLTKLSRLGHFIKGSSATLGLVHVRDNCEKIQNYGLHRDETGDNIEEDDEKCLENIRSTLKELRKHFKDVVRAFEKFYHFGFKYDDANDGDGDGDGDDADADAESDEAEEQDPEDK